VGSRDAWRDAKCAIEEALIRIAPHVRRTPCRRSAALSAAVGGEVFLKLENLQLTGSFKLRGALNKILSLTREESRGMLIAASTGNHGAAFAHAVRQFGLNGKLFIPTTAAPIKVEALRACGVPFEQVGDDCVETELRAAAYAREQGCVLVPPYNDSRIIHGQGTVALELLAQMEAIDTVLVPVGGGGLISGIGAYLKSVDPAIRVIGCQPRNSSVMYDSIRAGRIVDSTSLPTISDGTAGGIEPGALTFELCRRFVDEFVLLDEDEIVAAIRLVQEQERMNIEGAAALSVAAALKQRERFANCRVGLIVSGGKIGDATLRGIGCGDDPDHPA